jgi:hypothetical protein
MTAEQQAISIELPELVEREVTLEPRLRRVRGAALADPAARRPLDGYLAIGGPWVRSLTPSSLQGSELDDALRGFLEAEATDSDFYLVHITCTFRPAEDEPIQTAVLTVDLARPEGGDPPPIAWSMQPQRLASQTSLSRTVKLGATLKIMGVGVEGEAGQTQETQVDQVFLEALFEGLPSPTWELRRTDSATIQGLQRFALVVRAAKGTTTMGTARLGATITRKRFGLLPYTASLAEQEALEFWLPQPAAVDV